MQARPIPGTLDNQLHGHLLRRAGRYNQVFSNSSVIQSRIRHGFFRGNQRELRETEQSNLFSSHPAYCSFLLPPRLKAQLCPVN